MKKTALAPRCSDEQLMSWLNEGSPENESKAIDCLYRQLIPLVRPWIFSRNGSSDDAHDAVTEALIGFIRNFRERKYQEQGKLENYLFRLTQFKFYDRKRQKSEEEISIEDFFPGGIPDGFETESPIERAEEEEVESTLFKQMADCLENIGERCKERLIRFWYMEQRHEEIANAMGDASDRVSVTMKKKCQEKLEKCMNSNRVLVNA